LVHGGVVADEEDGLGLLDLGLLDLGLDLGLDLDLGLLQLLLVPQLEVLDVVKEVGT
jgi:hypothetical protein